MPTIGNSKISVTSDGSLVTIANGDESVWFKPEHAAGFAGVIRKAAQNVAGDTSFCAPPELWARREGSEVRVAEWMSDRDVMVPVRFAWALSAAVLQFAV